MTVDPLVLLAELDRATDRLLATVDAMETDPAVPSPLPGWTRGHVLTHIARNADGMVNLLTWARTGVVTPQYPSWERRNADIEAGAARPMDVLRSDVHDSAARFHAAAEEMPTECWTAELDLPGGRRPAALLVWRRLREVEVHHVDLGAGYGPADWPEAFAHRLLHEVCAGLQGIAITVRADSLGHPLVVGEGGPPEVSGTAGALAGWLTGRDAGDQLHISPEGSLPVLPDWI